MLKTNLLNLIVVLLLLVISGCYRSSEPRQINTNIEVTNKNVNSTSIRSDVKPLIDFISLVGKSPAEIEKIFGKPSDFDTKFIQLKQNGGKFGIYEKSGKRYLQVDYFNGKAVAFYLEIPANLQTKSPDDTLKLCGFDIQILDANTEKDGFWWDNPLEANPFYRTRISRYNDSGLYYNCEAHIKVN